MSHDAIVRQFQTDTDPVLRAIMQETRPAAERARLMAQQLNGKLEAGNLRRLPINELVDLRGLVFGLESLAEQLEAADVAAQPVREKLGFWATVFR
jgi:hypothetical protein